MGAHVWALAASRVLNPHGSFEHRAVARARDDRVAQAVPVAVAFRHVCQRRPDGWFADEAPAPAGRDRIARSTRTQQQGIAFAYRCFVRAPAVLGACGGLQPVRRAGLSKRSVVSTATVAWWGGATLSPAARWVWSGRSLASASEVSGGFSGVTLVMRTLVVARSDCLAPQLWGVTLVIEVLACPGVPS